MGTDVDQRICGRLHVCVEDTCCTIVGGSLFNEEGQVAEWQKCKQQSQGSEEVQQYNSRLRFHERGGSLHSQVRHQGGTAAGQQVQVHGDGNSSCSEVIHIKEVRG